jgi:hypothetical protein
MLNVSFAVQRFNALFLAEKPIRVQPSRWDVAHLMPIPAAESAGFFQIVTAGLRQIRSTASFKN